jgi:RNA polymerase sigma factor (sigma-70 family)
VSFALFVRLIGILHSKGRDRSLNQRQMSAKTAVCKEGMPDLELIRNFLKSRANPCFDLIYEKYAAKVYSKCIALLKDEAMAKDATQEIFMKVFLNLSKFGERARFSTWLYSITYNFCIDYLRKKKRRGNIFSDEMERAPDVEEDEVSDKVLLEMKVGHLRKVLEMIPPDDKYVLLMKYQEDLSIKEIAEVLDKSESAIKMKIKRAKTKAQSALREVEAMIN